ncbi:MAG: UbiA-like polyprenyltransferase [Chitinophagales bacterium]
MKNYLSLVTFSHTVFALPFAIIGFTLGITQPGAAFEWTDLLLVVACMVFARSAAMAFNRYIDADIDKKNARTAQREIPKGVISSKNALYFVIGSSVAFMICALLLNKRCFFLSPVALLVILGYSYTKRFTWLCHFILGIGLALAPIGAYLAVTETFQTLPLIFSFIVFTWVSGFDIIYALQDEEFDKSNHLYSLPAKLGKSNALIVSIIVHLNTALLVWYAGNYVLFDNLYWIGAGIFVSMLVYQHLIVKPNDLSKVNRAFFTANGIASVVFGIFVVVDLLQNF